MGAVAQVASEVAVLYLGKLVEAGEAAKVIASAAHPYTKALIAAVPSVGGKILRSDARGEIGDPANPPNGCRFHPRCPIAVAACSTTVPALAPFEGRDVACMRVGEKAVAAG
jgi:oligopeptide/dipeptide ABC transporter ATP-binding protein